MTPEDTAWQKLTAAARRVPTNEDVAVPYGFSTRVVSLAMAAAEPTIGSILDRFSWRALGVASLLAITSVAAGYTWNSTPSSEDLLSDEPMVAALFDPSAT